MAKRDPRTDALFKKAVRLREAGRPTAALPLYRQLVRRAPGDVLAAQHLGVLLTEAGDLAGGEAALRGALALNPAGPATRHALAINLMAQGRLVEAFPHYRARYDMPELMIRPPSGFPFPRWEGEPLAGKRLVIFPEQGLGDQIMYARFVPELQRRGTAVTLLALPPLARLFVDSFGADAVVVADGKVEFPDPDYWITSSEQAAACGTTYADLPAAPYLRATLPPPDLAPGFRTGLMTAGNPRYRHDARRSLPAAQAEALAAGLPGAVIRLAPEATGARDFADTAAIVQALDLVVTVDTSVAHLAGAMGRRTFVLLPGYGADWRWHGSDDGTPWYPNTRLFRSSTAGDWAPAVAAAIAAAREMAQ